eukprot:1148315-Pelagomonas_calceolata.AAC.4
MLALQALHEAQAVQVAQARKAQAVQVARAREAQAVQVAQARKAQAVQALQAREALMLALQALHEAQAVQVAQARKAQAVQVVHSSHTHCPPQPRTHMVFDIRFCAVRQELADLAPTVAILLVGPHKDQLLSRSPRHPRVLRRHQ